MAAVLASVIAVLGTLAGYMFQQRISERTEMLARHERLRQERMLACSAFAGAVMDMRRPELTSTYQRDARSLRANALIVPACRQQF